MRDVFIEQGVGSMIASLVKISKGCVLLSRVWDLCLIASLVYGVGCGSMSDCFTCLWSRVWVHV